MKQIKSFQLLYFNCLFCYIFDLDVFVLVHVRCSQFSLCRSHCADTVITSALLTNEVQHLQFTAKQEVPQIVSAQSASTLYVVVNSCYEIMLLLNLHENNYLAQIFVQFVQQGSTGSLKLECHWTQRSKFVNTSSTVISFYDSFMTAFLYSTIS